MKILIVSLVATGLILTCALFSCSTREKNKPEVLRAYPADNLEGIISQSRITPDTTDFTEGAASLKIQVEKPRSVKLFETGDIEVQNARLMYQAKLKSAALDGEAYLEMWCHFPGRGEFYSKALHSKISGNTSWSSHETIFTLGEADNPDNVRLNLVINGKGTVWIDDIKLIKVPIRQIEY